MEDELRRLRDCALKRDRHRAAAAQAEADARRLAAEARRKGASEEDIEHAFAGRPLPRLVRAREYQRGGRPPADQGSDAPRQPPPKRVDLEGEGWWANGDGRR